MKIPDITFDKFLMRIGNIEGANYYHRTGEHLQSHIKEHKNYSRFEISKYQPNSYYGKLNTMLKEGWRDMDNGFINKDNCSIDINCFKNSESKFVVASIDVKYREPEASDIVTGIRLIELSEDEKEAFMRISKEILEFITKQVYNEEI